MTKKRFITYWTGALLSYGVPIVSVGLVYGVFRAERSFMNYFTMTGLIASIVIGACFGKDFLDFLKTMGNDTGSTWAKYAKAPIVLSVCCGLLLFAYFSVENLMVVLCSSAVSNFAAIPIKAKHYSLLPEATKLRLETKKK